MKDRVHSQGEAVYRALRRLLKDLLSRKPGGHLAEGNLQAIDLQLPVPLQGLGAEPEAFSRTLVAAVERQIDEAIEQAAAFRPGHAYCHRCSGAVCRHARPPTPQHVFVGYGPTGTPVWLLFAQFCLESRHEQVHRLYDEPPGFLTLVQDAGSLRARLLQAWQNPAYRLLGQLTCGYYRLPAAPPDGKTTLALTMQVTSARRASGRMRLGLNILGPQHPDVAGPAGGAELPWQRAVRWAQTALAPVHGPAPQVEKRVAGILNGLARRLERDQRGRRRRTAHAEQRHQSGRRPTRKALDDIRLATPESYLVDERSGARVVLGERGRTHFFTASGRLVSSARYSRDAIQRKRKLGHWRAASADETQELQHALLHDGEPAS